MTESGLFSPPGFGDMEDGVGNSIRVSLRNDEDACSGLASVCHVRGNRDVPLKCMYLSNQTIVHIIQRYSKYSLEIPQCYRDCFNRQPSRRSKMAMFVLTNI